MNLWTLINSRRIMSNISFGVQSLLHSFVRGDSSKPYWSFSGTAWCQGPTCGSISMSVCFSSVKRNRTDGYKSKAGRQVLCIASTLYTFKALNSAITCPSDSNTVNSTIMSHIIDQNSQRLDLSLSYVAILTSVRSLTIFVCLTRYNVRPSLTDEQSINQAWCTLYLFEFVASSQSGIVAALSDPISKSHVWGFLKCHKKT